MHPRRFIVVALFLVLGLYSIYKGTFCENLVDIIEEEKRYEVKKMIVNKVVVNQGIISSISREHILAYRRSRLTFKNSSQFSNQSP